MKLKLYCSILAAIVLAGCTTSRPGSGIQSVHTEECQPVTSAEIASLFDRWNQSLQTGDPQQVAANYAQDAILLPTVSNQPRLSPAGIEDYFGYFLNDKPTGEIDLSVIELGCNSAVDSGLYTFTFATTGGIVPGRYTFTYRWNGSDWLITSHHSSAMPE